MTTPVPAEFEEIAESWRPEPQMADDVVTAEPASVFAALLDQPSPVVRDGDALPPLWHWFLFPAVHAQSELGEDGHPRSGALTPPLPERRRMFGGGRLVVHAPLRCGDQARQTSTVASVRTRVGSTGPLLLVTVRHEITVDGTLRLVEERDLVYRRAADVTRSVSNPAAAREDADPTPEADWSLQLVPDSRLLFRFSALTSNAHRIHYDHPYTTEVEGYPGLVVHGPLLALLMLELPRRRGHAVRSFDWRASRPAFEHARLTVRGTLTDDTASLAVGSDAGDHVAGRAEVATRPA